MSVSASLPTLPVRLVRRWVRLYTAGLPADVRDARREEIDADLWEQAREAALMARPTSTLRSEVALRLLLGVQADLLWRFAEARTHSNSTEGRSAMQTFTMRSRMGAAWSILMAVLVAASIALIAVHSIEYEDPSRRIMVPWLKYSLGISLLTAGIGLTVTGFRWIRQAPWLGALVAVGGLWMVAVLFYWLTVPLFIAAGASVFAIGWAKRRTNAG